jgi:hypothetical protein
MGFKQNFEYFFRKLRSLGEPLIHDDISEINI